MYEVSILNNDVKIIINAVSTSVDAPRIQTGTIRKGINSIDSFTFELLSNNAGFNLLKPKKTLIEVLNSKTNKVEFRGRVLLPTPKMDNSGNISLSVICEGELGYLNDSTTRYGEYHDMSVREFLKLILDNHNSMVSDEKKFQLGIVEIEANLYRFLDYEESFKVINDKLIERLGGEIRIRHENGVRYFDYLKSIGTYSNMEIRLSKNLKTIDQEKDPTSIIPRLVPLGAKLEDSDERITIKSVNNNLDYIDDIEAINEFGLSQNVKVWDDVNIPSILLSKAKEMQKELNRIKKKHKVEALDLSLIDIDIGSFEVGNWHKVVNPIMNIDEELRIVEKTIKIESPQKSSLIIGDKFEDIKTYQLEAINNVKNIDTVKQTLYSTVNMLNSVSSELTDTVNILNNTNQSLGNVNEIVQVNINATNVIATNLVGVTEKLDKICRRVQMEV